MRILPFLVIVCCLLGCKKEESFSNLGTITNIKLSGRIVNELKEPLKGIKTTVNSSTATSNLDGIFSYNLINVSSDAASIKVDDARFYSITKNFKSSNGGHQIVDIELITKKSIGTINSATGGNVFFNDANIRLESNAVVFEDSRASYNGIINIFATYIPANIANCNKIPGDGRGLDADKKQFLLSSIGYIAVELLSTDGKKLQIADNKKATIRFPAPANTNLPNSLNVYSLNDTTGFWKLEGVANKVGNYYNAEVTHFSWWTTGIQYNSFAEITAQCKRQNGSVIKNQLFELRNLSWQGFSISDSINGIFSMYVPANTITAVTPVNQSCNTTNHINDIGPFLAGSSNQLNLIFNDTFPRTIIYGKVNNCNNLPLSNGYVELLENTVVTRRMGINADGSFSAIVANCNRSAFLVRVLATDLSTNSQSQAVDVVINPNTSFVTLNSITACGSSAVEYLNFTLNGTNFNFNGANSTKSAFLNIFGNINASSNYCNVNGNSFSPYSYIDFNFLGTIVGNRNLMNLSVFVPGQTDSLRLSSNAIVTVTEISNTPGSYVAGSFNTSVQSSTTNQSYPIQCNFRVRR